MGHDADPGAQARLTDSGESAAAGSLGEDISRLLAEVQSLVSDQLLLMALEAQGAARALGLIAACGIASGMLLAFVWLGLGVAFALWLMEWGLRASAAVLVSTLTCALGLAVLWTTIRRASVALTFAATRKSLQRITVR